MNMTLQQDENNILRSADLPFTPGETVKLPAVLDDPERATRWQQQLHNPAYPVVIDLFCGAGGMSAGFVDAGFVIAAALDTDQNALDTFAANIPALTKCTDLTTLENPSSLLDSLGLHSVDVIMGGPPCQGFSMAGRARIRSLNDGLKKQLFMRNELYQDFFRFIEVFNPPFFLFENVQGLLSFEDGAYIRAIEEECTRLGYVPHIAVIDAVDYGVPQFRRRLFVIGSRVGRLFRWPRTIAEADRTSLADAISDLPAVLPPSLEECLPHDPMRTRSRYQQLMRSRVPLEDRNRVYDHVVRPVRDDDKIIFQQMEPGHRYTDIPAEFRRYDDTKFKDKYYMLKPDEPGNTITAHMAKDGYRYIHWDTRQHRTLSVREAARIQSFGDHFRFSGSRTSRFIQIGNAVPPLLAEQLGRQIYRALQRASGTIQPGEALQPALPHPDWRHHTYFIDTTTNQTSDLP